MRFTGVELMKMSQPSQPSQPSQNVTECHRYVTDVSQIVTTVTGCECPEKCTKCLCEREIGEMGAESGKEAVTSPIYKKQIRISGRLDAPAKAQRELFARQRLVTYRRPRRQTDRKAEIAALVDFYRIRRPQASGGKGNGRTAEDRGL